MHSFLPTYLGRTFFPLLDISEQNFLFSAPTSPPPPTYAPVNFEAELGVNQFRDYLLTEESINSWKTRENGHGGAR